MENIIACNFCDKEVEINAPHDCTDQLFKLVNSIAEIKDENNALRDIDNLVFQGGGVKGISYLGVVQQLNNLKQYPGFLRKVKRVAGTSAGSLIALYLGLTLKAPQIKELLSLPYPDLLDDDVKLMVCTNPTANIVAQFITGGRKYIYPSARVVFLSVLEKFAALKEVNNANKEKGEAELTDMLTDVLEYFEVFGDWKFRTFMYLAAPMVAQYMTQFIFDALTPKAGDEEPLPADQEDEAEEMAHHDQFRVTIQESCEKAVKRVQARQRKAQLLGFHHSDKEMMQHEMEEEVKEAIQPEKKEEEVKDEAKVLSEEEQKHIDYYKKERIHSHDTKEVAPKGRLLNYAIAEMMWFLSSGHTHDYGLFSADVIKEKLINEPIQKRFKEFGITNENPTFEEMAAYVDENGNKVFKDIFVTAYNCATERTEVFSVASTPHVLVADAVRASMSIPVFFMPVTIREKNMKAKGTYNDQGVFEETKYMDGGILDNYPIWIFDDLKFCLEDQLAADWVPHYKLTIQNPKTLGFRILDEEMIERYRKPYYDDGQRKIKRTNTSNYSKNFGYIMGSVMDGFTGQEENAYINQGHCPRSAYINNLGYTAVSFNLGEKGQKALIREGRKAVLEYLCRAEKTHFIGEGQSYDGEVAVNF